MNKFAANEMNIMGIEPSYSDGTGLGATTSNPLTHGQIATFDIGNKDKDRRQLTSQGMGAVGNLASGIASIASGIIGGAQRREEQRAAKAAYEEQLQAYRALDTSSPYRDITNPYEDLTVNQQQAQFIAQQQQQGLATTMASVGAATTRFSNNNGICRCCSWWFRYSCFSTSNGATTSKEFTASFSNNRSARSC
jgi:hypothetical protein